MRIFKAYTAERVWKDIGDSFRRPCYLIRVENIWKIMNLKQRTDIGKYSFVNRTIKNWNQLPTEELGTFPCKHKTFKNRVRKETKNGLK
jgi:hypothetical protein